MARNHRTERELDKTLVTQPDRGAMTLSAERPDADSVPGGTPIGPYIVDDMIGCGGGGTVYAARHAVRGDKVAIKVLHSEMATSPQGLLRFQREARVVNLIRHPAIVEIYDFGQLPDGRPYFVMELLEGSDLTELIRQRGRFAPEAVVEIVGAVCSALEAAHAANVVHRDLKASNVHVSGDGKRGYKVKLLDFGIAKLLAPDPEMGGLTQPGALLGTASAMAPEQIKGEPVDPRTDVYALGVLIYHMLVGHYPFRAESRQEVDRMNLEAAPPRPSQSVMVPAAVDAVVLRCMEKRRERRYRSAAEVAAALREAMATAGNTAATATTVEDRALQRKQAVAIQVDVHFARGADESDDQVLSDAADALDLAAQTLVRGGFLLSLQTATTLLAARTLSDEPRAALEERKRALEEAVALVRELATGPGSPGGAFRIDVSAHVDAAMVRGAPPALELAGPAVDVSSWPVTAPWKGVRVTPAAVADFE